MKTRTAVGGAIVIALVAGAYFGSKFPGFGLGNGGTGIVGTGDSESADPGNMQNVLADASQSAARTVSSREAETAESEAPSIAGSLASEGPVLQVRIEGRNFEVGRRVGETWEYTPIALNDLVALAQKSTGDEQGIRVRVSRLSSAKASAELMLRDELVKMGVTEDSIDWRDGPRP